MHLDDAGTGTEQGGEAGHRRVARGGSGDSSQRRTGWLLAVLLGLCALPLVAAATAVALKGWVPVGEFAQAELRVRDFWAHPPLLGAVGRLRTPTHVTSHPGPAAWYAMYPVYAIAGRSAVALSAAVASTAFAWAAAAVILAWRRAGDALAAAVCGGVLLLMASLGPISFIEPWNPWFTVMPFLAMVVAAWAVVDGSPWALVMVVAAGSYCVQAHFGYLPLVGLLGVISLVGLVRYTRRFHDMARVGAAVGVALVIGLVMWLPPIIEQLTNDPGNVTLTVEAYRQEAGNEPALGLGGAVRLTGAYLNVTTPLRLSDDSRATDRGMDLGTVAMLVGLGIAAFLAWRRRSDQTMGRAAMLLGVVGVSLVGSLVTASRIPGEVFTYLILWLVVLVVMGVTAMVWIAWIASRHQRVVARFARGVGLVVLAALCVSTTIGFARTSIPAEPLSDVGGELINQLGNASAPGWNPDSPDDRAYLVRWEDPASFGALGTAVLSELERSGTRVGVDERLSVEMRPHRVLNESDAYKALWVVTGDGIESWRALGDEVTELAYVDPRTEAQRADARRLTLQIQDELRAIGGEELAEELPINYWAVRSDPRVGRDVDDQIDRLTSMGLPTAVFLAPADMTQPGPH